MMAPTSLTSRLIGGQYLDPIDCGYMDSTVLPYN